MEKKKLAVTLEDALRGTVHGGKVDVRVLINEDTVGSKSFSLLVNTIKADDTCLQEGTKGHKHEVEHGVYCLSGRGSIVIEGQGYPLNPGTAVFVPANQMHYLENLSADEDLTYIILYVPAGEEKMLLAKG